MRELKKFFNAFAANRVHTQLTRKKFKPVLEKNYQNDLRNVINKWKKFRDHKQTKAVKKKQIMLEEEVMEASKAKNDSNDVVFAQEKKR